MRELENRMLTLMDRYEEQEIEEYHIFREYYLFIDTDAERAQEITKEVLDSIDFQITDAQDTQDGLVMVIWLRLLISAVSLSNCSQ